MKHTQFVTSLNADAAAKYLGISAASFRELRRRFPIKGDTGPAHNPQWSATRYNGHLASVTLDAWASQHFLRALLTTRRSLEAQRLTQVVTAEHMRREEQRRIERDVKRFLKTNPPVNARAKAA